MVNNIVILGSGNVASNFVDVIKNTDIKILQIYSRNIENAIILCKQANSEAINDINKLTNDADAYFFMLSDEGIIEISKNIKNKKGILVHIAGSVSKDIFKGKSENYGVIYPFQTFTKGVDIPFDKVHAFIEGSNNFTTSWLFHFSEKLGFIPHLTSEEERKYIHLSGVFACNFMNHCIYLGERILEDKGIDKEYLKPLLQQSFDKVLTLGAKQSQTGPAKRMDDTIIKKHLELLKNDKLRSEIYKIITDSIYKTYNENEL
jgi:predicted short-subunit dehydrogenase-like oxidoreductase (DUF2520 family)